MVLILRHTFFVLYTNVYKMYVESQIHIRGCDLYMYLLANAFDFVRGFHREHNVFIIPLLK